MSRSRSRLNAKRRLATVGFLPSVIIGSTTRRSSLALGSVVLMTSCLSSELVMFLSMARRWLLVRLSFLSPRRWRISRASLSFRASGADGFQPDGRPVFELHAQSKTARGEHFLDLVERLASQIRGLQQFRLGPLYQIADVIDILGLQAVRRAHGELEIVHGPKQ